MKKVFTFFITSFIFLSCSTGKFLPLKGNYSEKPFIAYSDKTVDEVWSKLIDIFATKGITIKIIDKSSGLIVSDDYSFIKAYTFETSDGKLQNPTAWLVYSTASYLFIAPHLIWEWVEKYMQHQVKFQAVGMSE